jgi:hypothetical protein
MMFSPISPSATSLPVAASIDQVKTFISLTCTPSPAGQPGAKASISAMPSSSPAFAPQAFSICSRIAGSAVGPGSPAW